MPIPFIRKLPNGHRKTEQVERPVGIENQARAFLDRGGRYLIEVQTDLKVHLMAILDVPRDGIPGTEEIAHLECDNGPGILSKVDELVRASINNSPPPPESKIIPFRKPELIIAT